MLIEYVRHWAGGKDPVFLSQLQAYTRTLKTTFPMRHAVLKPLVTADVGFKLGAKFRSAAMMAIAQHGNFVTPNLFNCMTKKRAGDVLKAETAMIAFEEHAKESANRVAICGQHNVACVFQVGSASKKHGTLRDVGAHYYNELMRDPSFRNPKADWANPYMTPSKAKKTAPPAEPVVGMTRLAQDGKCSISALMGALEERGVKPDAIVVELSSGRELIIVAIGDKVSMYERKDKRRKLAVSLQDCVDKFKVKVETEKVSQISSNMCATQCE